MADPTRFIVEVGPAPEDALVVHEFETLEDLAEELRTLHAGSALALSFHWKPGHPVPLSAAAQCCGSELSTRALGEVRCYAASPRAREELERALSPRGGRQASLVVGSCAVRVIEGNIATTYADAIVNASNTRLVLGTGVSGAIKREASDPAALQAAMSALAPLGEGAVVATRSWLAAAPTLLHVATAAGGEEVVRRALAAVLAETRRTGWARIAIPALGCGTGGLAIERFAALARKALEEAAFERPLEVLFVLRGEHDHAAFLAGFG